MRRRLPWFFLTMLVLIGSMGCQSKTTPVASPEDAPTSGCQVERLEAAEEAVRQLFEHSEAYVYSIDGDLASCKFEVFYKADVASTEKPVFTASGDSVAEQMRLAGGVAKVDTGAGNNHHLLIVVVPEYPPRPEDKYVVCFLIRANARGDGDEKNCESRSRKSEEAGKILPSSVLAQGGGFGHWGSPSTKSRTLKPDEEFTFLDMTFHRSDASLGGDAKKATLADLLRYRLTAKCLDATSQAEQKTRAKSK